ncbi:MAG: excinuclease ABC subunit A, partial [Planctomycetota bacterium]
VDRMSVSEEARPRLRDAIGQAIEHGGGDLSILGEEGERGYSTLRTCSECGVEAPPLEPRLFSFNSNHGACSLCEGLGVLKAPTESRVIRSGTLSLRQGALAVTRASGGALLFPKVDFAFLTQVADANGFDLDTPWCEMSEDARSIVLYGSGDQYFRDESSWNGAKFSGKASFERQFRGVIPSLRRAWKKGHRKKMVEKLLEETTCDECHGSRLNAFATAVTVGGVHIGELLSAPIEDLGPKLKALPLSSREAKIASELLSEIMQRLAFMEEVGLSYLSLSRSADTLSGGESQRIRLAAQLGAGLQGVLYVLDEPSIGLHPRDHGRLLGALRQLVELGNTVVVVEHDEATLRAADRIIDVGPAAGNKGGRIVAAGTPNEVSKADSPTGQLLRGEIVIPTPETRRAGNGNVLKLNGATGFNLHDVDIQIPLGSLIAVTGVSGSGKSTLIASTLSRALLRELGREAPAPEKYASLEGFEKVDELVAIDGAPIGRTPRSNPATYTGAFSPIRDLYAQLPESKMRGWGPGRFSFNIAGGRCEACLGAGAQFVELQFLAPVTVPCEECGGHRFQAETLEIRFRGKNIADVLELTVEEATEFFADHPKIARPLKALNTVGLGYLTLGQPSTTLSGGEAQRVKLAKHLQKGSPRSHVVYLLDEPTTGLHPHDVSRLVGALQLLVDKGHTVLVIEHDLDLIRAADYVIDMGPEGGNGGGHVIVTGTPEEIEAHATSHTGLALRQLGEARQTDLKSMERPPGPGPRDSLRVINARTHNLKHLTVEIPRDAFTVVTGPSGSGKSSLCLDTIHAAGRQRFVESLSTYARQFLSSRDKPPVDKIEGLGPSISVEATGVSGHPRSTISTTTELHDQLRVLWSKAGTRHCPTHGELLEKSDASKAAKQIASRFEGQKGWIVAPIFGQGLTKPKDWHEAFTEAAAAWQSGGYARILVDGAEVRLAGEIEVPKSDARVDLVMDRLAFGESTRARIAESVEQAESISGGRVSVLVKVPKAEPERHEFSTTGACTHCGYQQEEELEPRHFSFNTHAGACPSCDGLGEHWQCDADLLVDTPELQLLIRKSGEPTAISGKLGRYLTKGKGYYEHLLRAVAKSHRIDLYKPFNTLTEKQRDLLLYGTGAREKYEVSIEKHSERVDLEEHFSADWPGLCGHVDAWHAKAEDAGWRSILEGFMSRSTCRSCQGERLAPGPRSVVVGKQRLPQLLSFSVKEAREWLAKLKLKKSIHEAVEPVLAELSTRLELLYRVGLDYLSLDRPMSTLSGGEARRVRLSASLGSHLVGVCYVLDEPTVGLHPRDIDQLTDALLELRDRGNTVIVVEHDESVMRRADHLVDMGPGAGRYGGTVVVQGTPDEVIADADSLTGKALRGELKLTGGEHTKRNHGELIGVHGASLFNLKQASMEVRYGQLTGICGPSGSGKSTLVMGCLVPGLQGERPAGRWKNLTGTLGGGRRVLVVDAGPLGRSPSSVPATAIGLMDPLRDLFVRTPDARMKGFTRAHFSFNSKAGRCPLCEGKGVERIEMQFLADLWLNCEECNGGRYKPEILEIKYRGVSIAELLAMPAEEALEFLEHQPTERGILQTLCDVGLGYMALGQSSTTLSSGEAQRVKLAAELMRTGVGERSVIILDEPTTGLHMSDVTHLYKVLRRLAQRGDAVIVIEHHLELLAACDHLIELGPTGGSEGGNVIAIGSPAELVSNPDSITGPWFELQASSARARKATKGGKSSKGSKAGLSR